MNGSRDAAPATGVAEFALPDLGEGLTDAVVVRWLVEVGEPVEIDQPIVEVESAKALVEIPCPYAGIVESRHGRAGEVLAVGSPLVRVRERTGTVTGPSAGSASVGAPGPARPQAAFSAPLAGDLPRQPPAAGGPALVGFGPAAVEPAQAAGVARWRRRTPRIGGHQPALGIPRPNGAATSDDVVTSNGTRALDGAVRPTVAAVVPAGRAGRADAADSASAAVAPRVISPVVRRLAQTAGLDLGEVPATGAGGVVRRADVEHALAAARRAEHRPPPSPDPVASDPVTSDPVTSDPVTSPTVHRVPLATRRVVVERMVRSRREIPEATAWRDVDFTDLLAARDAINALNPDRPVSVPGLLARICVAGLARHPELNATVDTERDEIIRYPSVHLGFAIAGAAGLVVPVVRNADAMTAPRLTERLSELTTRARDRALTPAELTGGTFTINNHGALGTDGAVPIINHPEVAQLAVGRIAERPWVVNGEIHPRKVAQLTVAFDHRACDGSPVAGFITFLAHCVEQPLTMIAEL
ncbi:2-oxo acid dehydrogenase subunit E2 [Frankia sp. CNm7]|uniref:Dihydrolipoamide acetyltransferase component of pyruvate dehydrogenase complex n=1 Tax=Frankia nepalensis TaxID=1836974 RepID=A0A937RH35_9ACTN|nr:dihydrolipoamide acetyltransferase family protein [Frankia nepalensis]MBL7500395.1 2-oxo acid dehydrogenase subunit E2 [Frankia nepalensis]MBL7508693.1 2-oxo acid dehydrogenase subunit E2 [Frankia nepalensis]MBL7520673.1 2-oxo acid dehydrogenase subunit E2 [Frankia nepalensis]MBL7628855.1 2-oxo acid dehydrogenase subunit E2 [Frankia nepalensis]